MSAVHVEVNFLFPDGLTRLVIETPDASGECIDEHDGLVIADGLHGMDLFAFLAFVAP